MDPLQVTRTASHIVVGFQGPGKNLAKRPFSGEICRSVPLVLSSSCDLDPKTGEIGEILSAPGTPIRQEPKTGPEPCSIHTVCGPGCRQDQLANAMEAKFVPF